MQSCLVVAQRRWMCAFCTQTPGSEMQWVNKSTMNLQLLLATTSLMAARVRPKLAAGAIVVVPLREPQSLHLLK